MVLPQAKREFLLQELSLSSSKYTTVRLYREYLLNKLGIPSSPLTTGRLERQFLLQEISSPNVKHTTMKLRQDYLKQQLGLPSTALSEANLCLKYFKLHTDYTWQATLLATINGGNTVWSMLYLDNNEFLAGTGSMGKIFKSYDNGETWEEKYDSTNYYIFDMINLGNNIIIATPSYGGAIIRSEDNGETWNSISLSFEMGRIAGGLVDLGNGKTGCLSGYIQAIPNWRSQYIFSSDYGLTWEIRKSFDFDYSYSSHHTSHYVNGNICLMDVRGRFLKSNDEGYTWSVNQIGLSTSRKMLYLGGKTLLSYNGSVIFKSSDLGDTWESKDNLGSIYSLGNTMKSNVLVSQTGRIIQESKDGGESFTSLGQLAPTGNTTYVITFAGEDFALIAMNTYPQASIYKLERIR